MRTSSPKILALLGLVLTNLFWAGNAVVARYAAIVDIPPFSLAFIRWALAFIILLPFAWSHLRNKSAAIKQRWSVILVLGLLGITIFNTLFYLSAYITTAINISMVNASLPLVTLLVSWLLIRTVPSKWQMTGIIAALTGVLIIITRGDLAVLQQLNFNQGDILILLLAFVWASYTVILRKYPVDLHPIALLTVIIAAGLPVLFSLMLVELALLPVVDIPIQPAAMLALYIALFPSIFAYLLWGYGVKVLGPNITALSTYLMPVLTALIAVPLLGERLNSYHIVGGLMILLGLYLASVFKQKL